MGPIREQPAPVQKLHPDAEHIKGDTHTATGTKSRRKSTPISQPEPKRPPSFTQSISIRTS